MKLYFALRTRATRARWLLEELGIPYELVRLDLSKHEQDTPEYRALQPFGELPVLVDGDTRLFDSTAICLYLADRFPEKHLAPAPGSAERAPYLQWMLFAQVTLEPQVLEHLRNAELPEAQRRDLSEQRVHLEKVLTVLDEAVGGREFVAGDAFSAADVLLASVLHMAHRVNLLEKHPRLLELVVRHTRRPASRRAVSG
ncbi:glutathione S-transferase family protein [Pyxidicoccus xibeiensis]|uniref:glutathione S-transferase family protein n=1 Tax=Pyxidicoccus xibeiensis TaxID=2906759 RepID=UPI0020A776FA|nr:glutathione S-transferase family protein [Pyxidicoccus xibeiensis]MCP3143837.1 glutathione S-transferase family protein [Pyxidicoccus xibeiensis]